MFSINWVWKIKSITKMCVFLNCSYDLKIVILQNKFQNYYYSAYFYIRYTSLVWVPFVPHLCVHNVQLAGAHLGEHGSIEHDCDFNGSKPGSHSSVGTGIESFFWAHQTSRVLVPLTQTC